MGPLLPRFLISPEGVLESSSRGRLKSTWPVHRPSENLRRDARGDLRLIGWLEESVRMLGLQIRSHHRVTVPAQEKWIFVSPRPGEGKNYGGNPRSTRGAF